MTVVEIEELIARLAGGEHETYAVATPEEVFRTEDALGTRLPESFATFVRTFGNGAYLYGVQEVSAVGDGNPQIAPIQAIERVPRADPSTQIPFRDGGGTFSLRDAIPFSLDHNGNEWCFLVEAGLSSNEYPVAYLSSGCSGQLKLYGRLAGFIDWLELLVARKEEVIRTLYDEKVLYEELCLG